MKLHQHQSKTEMLIRPDQNLREKMVLLFHEKLHQPFFGRARQQLQWKIEKGRLFIRLFIFLIFGLYVLSTLHLPHIFVAASSEKKRKRKEKKKKASSKKSKKKKSKKHSNKKNLDEASAIDKHIADVAADSPLAKVKSPLAKVKSPTDDAAAGSQMYKKVTFEEGGICFHQT